MQNLKNMFKNNAGSALIGAVVIAAVLSISAVAYAALVRNTVSQEVLALNDRKAYLTAEAGLYVALNWLGSKDNFEAAKGGKIINDVFPDSIEAYKSYAGVRCSLTFSGIGDTILVTSSAVGNDRGFLPYIKSLSVKVRGIPSTSSGRFAFYVNDIGPDAFFPNVDTASTGLQHGAAFFGPVHTNTPIMLSWRAFDITNGCGNKSKDYPCVNEANAPYMMVHGARFYGHVSTWGGWYDVESNKSLLNGYKDKELIWEGFGIGSRGDNYGKGVIVNVNDGIGSTPATISSITDGYGDPNNKKRGLTPEDQLDRVFRGGFDSNGERLEMRFEPDKVSTKYNTVSTVVAADVTPRIKFGYESGKPYFQVDRNGTGNYNNVSKTYYTAGVNTIIYAGTNMAANGSITNPHNIEIESGSVLAGNVTVVTGDGKDIIFSFNTHSTATDKPNGDNILYESIRGYKDINVDNFSTYNVLRNTALDTGAARYDHLINVLHYNKVRPNLNEVVKDGSVNDNGLNLDGRLSTKVNHLFGFYSGRDIVIKRPPANTKDSLEGNFMLTAQLFAKNGKVKIDENSGHKDNYGFRLHVVGSVAMDKWWDKDPGLINTIYNGTVPTSDRHVGKEVGSIRTYHDQRMRNGDYMSAPGISYGEFGGGNAASMAPLIVRNWTEKNTPRSN